VRRRLCSDKAGEIGYAAQAVSAEHALPTGYTVATMANMATLEMRLEARMGAMETRLMKWSIGTAIGLAGTLTGVMVAVLRLAHP
jgi:hypothetical protein